MFYACQTAPRFGSTLAALLIMASWSGLAAAQSGDQWRAAGTTSSASAQPTAAASTNPTWRLPNGQTNAGDSSQVDEDSNPLRQARKSQPTANAAEPRAFQAPMNAAPI